MSRDPDGSAMQSKWPSGQDTMSPKGGGQQVITVARLVGPDNFR